MKWTDVQHLVMKWKTENNFLTFPIMLPTSWNKKEKTLWIMMTPYRWTFALLLCYVTLIYFKPAVCSIAPFYCCCIQICHASYKELDWKCGFAAPRWCRNTFNRNWFCSYRSILLLQTQINSYWGNKHLKTNSTAQPAYNTHIKITADLSEGKHSPTLHHVVATAELPSYHLLLCKHLMAYLNLPIKHSQEINC